MMNKSILYSSQSSAPAVIFNRINAKQKKQIDILLLQTLDEILSARSVVNCMRDGHIDTMFDQQKKEAWLHYVRNIFCCMCASILLI